MFACRLVARQPMRATSIRPAFATTTTGIQTTPPRRFYAPPSKSDLHDREAVNPESTEYSKSGGDGAAATTEDAAFNPDKTRPEEERASAGRESGGEADSPLNASPANPELGKPASGANRKEGSRAETGDGGGERSGASGGGSAPKSK